MSEKKASKTILVIEDDKNLSKGISFNFEQEGFKVLCADTLEIGREMFRRHEIDILIIDLNLPDGDGIDLCQSIREKSNVPIIILTARDMVADEIAGLTAGADDYITKPFSISVLRARVDAALRRFEKPEAHMIYSGEFKLDTNLCKLFRASREIPISTTQFRLLKLFMSNTGVVLSKEQILEELWDNQGEFVDKNTLSVNINRLRSKIEIVPRNPKIIKTIHGIGYIWLAPM